ncbi:MAG: hypothetical protein IPL79_10530 [Myxococcales bacterium]|nr:hypothetical protein [Myxococcales bacterium]
MSARLQSSVRTNERACYVKLAGVIDENNALAAIAVPAKPGPIYIDCGDIERINSCGVRDWIRWVDALTASGGRLVLVDCAPPIVAQLNLVANFSGSTAQANRVRSVQLPYFCGTCDEEQVVTVELRDLAANLEAAAAPACRCRTCDATMDFDDIPESYFSFLAARRVAVDTSDDDTLLQFVSAPSGLLRPRVPHAAGLAAAPERTSNRAGAMPSLLALSSVPSLSNVRSSAPMPEPAATATANPRRRHAWLIALAVGLILLVAAVWWQA